MKGGLIMTYVDNQRLRTFTIIFLMLLPFIDTFNGIVVTYNLVFPIGIIFRISFYLYMIAVFFRDGIREHRLLLFLTLFFSISVVSFSTPSNLLKNIYDVSKWLYPIYIIELFLSLNKHTSFSLNDLTGVLYFHSFIFPLTIIIPFFLRIGRSTYGSSGFKGFYYATNDISYVLICLFIFCFFKYINKKNSYTLLCLILLIFSILILGTKSGYITIALVLIGYFLFNFKKFITLKHLILFLLFAISVGIILNTFLLQIIDRWLFFYQKNTNFLSFITSSRVDRIIPHLQNLLSSEHFIKNLFLGRGIALVPGEVFLQIEMDIFDLFFQYGLVGLNSIFYYLFTCMKKIDLSRKLFIVILFWSFVNSLFAGHVLNSALSSTVFAIIVSSLIVKKKRHDTYCIKREEKKSYILLCWHLLREDFILNDIDRVENSYFQSFIIKLFSNNAEI